MNKYFRLPAVVAMAFLVIIGSASWILFNEPMRLYTRPVTWFVLAYLMLIAIIHTRQQR